MIKNVKKGFSLAEVLIAIAIVGVIAAINIPTVVSETQNRKHAAALGRNVEAIETGCQLIIQQASEAGGEVIDGIYTVKNDLTGATSEYFDRLPVSNVLSNVTADFFNISQRTYNTNGTPTYNVNNINGQNPIPTLKNLTNTNQNFWISSKTGALYGYRFVRQHNTETTNDPIIGYIYIDVNAASAPNRYGRDIFVFGLTDSCHMIPGGSDRMSGQYSIPVETSGCANDNPTNGLSCTSRVVKNGYRMDY